MALCVACFSGRARTGLPEKGHPSLQEIFQIQWEGATAHKGMRARELSGRRGVGEGAVCLGNATQPRGGGVLIQSPEGQQQQSGVSYSRGVYLTHG